MNYTDESLASKVAKLEHDLAEARKQLAALPKLLEGFQSGKFYRKKSDHDFIFFVTNSANIVDRSTLYSREEVKEGKSVSTGRRVSAILVKGGVLNYRVGLLLSSYLPEPRECEEIQGSLSFIPKV